MTVTPRESSSEESHSIPGWFVRNPLPTSNVRESSQIISPASPVAPPSTTPRIGTPQLFQRVCHRRTFATTRDLSGLKNYSPGIGDQHGVVRIERIHVPFDRPWEGNRFVPLRLPAERQVCDVPVLRFQDRDGGSRRVLSIPSSIVAKFRKACSGRLTITARRGATILWRPEETPRD